jgi:hypothetical protein
METYKKDLVSWNEVYALLKDAISYGDDPFEDMYSELLFELEKEKDKSVKKNMAKVLQIMDLLRTKIWR